MADAGPLPQSDPARGDPARGDPARADPPPADPPPADDSGDRPLGEQAQHVEEVESQTRGAASGIYGLVVAGATFATTGAADALWQVVVAVVTTTFVYWVAETYAHGLARRLVVGRTLTRREKRRIASESWGLFTATYVPLVVLLVAVVVGATVEVAVDLALVAVTVLLGAIGWRAGQRAGMRGARLVWGTCVWVALGLAMAALKQLLH
jgi:hypothetical protein